MINTPFMNLFRKENLLNVLVLCIFVLAFLLRFVSLSTVPKGLYPDETAIGANANSILQTGKDEYATPYPLYFRSFDDYKLPVYIYSTAFFIKLLGVNAFAVRVTSALFGFLAVVATFFLVLLLSKNKLLAAASGFFLAVNPWHTFFSRAGYEVNVATSLITIGMLFFILAVHKKNNVLLLIISTCAFLLSVYTYSVTRLIAPIIFIVLLLFYRKKLATSSKAQLAIPLVLFVIGMAPFVMSFISLQQQPGFSSQKDTLIIGNATKADLLQTRSYFIQLPGLFQKIIFNYWVLVGFTYIKNLVSFFSTPFFFTTGSEHPNQSISGMAMFYYFEFPFIMYGAYVGIKKRVSYLYPFYLWLLVIFLAGSIIVSVPNGTRTFPVVIPLAVFSAYGFYLVIENLIKIRNKFVKYVALITLISFMLYSYLFYFTSYFVRYPIEHAKDWRSEDQRTVRFITSIQNNYNKIVFDESSDFFYTSLMFYGNYPFSQYQKTAVYRMNGLVDTLVSAGKYEFRNIDWKKENPQPSTLYITGRNNVPSNVNVLNTIDYPTRPIVLYYNRKIGQLPTTDTAYVIFDVK